MIQFEQSMAMVRFEWWTSLGIIHTLPNASRGEEDGYLDLLRYCWIYMEGYSTERYDMGMGQKR